MDTVSSNTLILEFADGEYTFKLNLPQINELQRLCGTGLGAIYARVVRGRGGEKGEVPYFDDATYRAEDVNETIRLALIGGGQGRVGGESFKVDAIRAKQLCETYVEPQSYKDRWALAWVILANCVEGYAPAERAAAKVTGSKKKPPMTAPSTTPAP